MSRFEEFCVIVMSAVAIVILAFATSIVVIWFHRLNVFIIPCMIIGLAFGMVYANRKSAQK